MPRISDILVVASCSNGRVDPETYDLLAFADALCRWRPGRVRVLVVGEEIDAAALEIARKGGVDVTAVSTPGISNYVCEAYRAILVEELRASTPALVCAAHTSQGWEWAPAVAARIGADCISGINGVFEADGHLCFERDLYGGKVKGRYALRAATTIITLQPGIFKFTPGKNRSPGRLSRKTAAYRLKRTRFLGTRQATADTASISEAPIVVSVGNGIGDQENLNLICRLAGMLPKAVVAGTRILCDRGWLGYHQQVGVTGATVAPALYIALGISGTAQHVMGMSASGFVIAVNTDRRAPIFNQADIGVVEDITRFIPLLLDTYEQLKITEENPGASCTESPR